MKYTGDVSTLTKLGYTNNFYDEYRFKTMRKTVDNKEEVSTTIFINNTTGVINFAGSERFKDDLLAELGKEVLSND